MLRKLAAPVAITALLAAAPVLADEQSGESGADHYEKTFSGENASGSAGNSGELNRDQAFDELDRNQDGKLDEDELNTWGDTAAGNAGDAPGMSEKRTQRMLQQFDSDDDNALTREELDAGPGDTEETTGAARGSNL